MPTVRLFDDLDRFCIDAEIAASWIDDPGSIRNPLTRDMMFRAGRNDAACRPESSPVKPTLLSVESAEAPSAPGEQTGRPGKECQRQLQW